MPGVKPQRGEVWWVEFKSSVGSEIQKTRPAVIVSINDANDNMTRVQVVPLTSNINRLYAAEAYVTVKGQSLADRHDSQKAGQAQEVLERIQALVNPPMESAIYTHASPAQKPNDQTRRATIAAIS